MENVKTKNKVGIKNIAGGLYHTCTDTRIYSCLPAFYDIEQCADNHGGECGCYDCGNRRNDGSADRRN